NGVGLARQDCHVIHVAELIGGETAILAGPDSEQAAAEAVLERQPTGKVRCQGQRGDDLRDVPLSVLYWRLDPTSGHDDEALSDPVAATASRSRSATSRRRRPRAARSGSPISSATRS